MAQENSNSKGNSLLPLIVAAAAGAVGAFLYQKENRDKVKAKIDTVKEKGVEKIAQKVDEVKQKGSEQLGVIQEKLEEGQVKADKEIDRAKSKLDETSNNRNRNN